MRFGSLALLVLLVGGCRTQQPQAAVCPPCAAAAEDAGSTALTSTSASLEPASVRAGQPEPTTSSPHVTPLAVCEAKGKHPLEAARDYADAHQPEKALSCAAQASALAPDEVLAHVERGNALVALERHDEAKLAFTRALALEPESLDALLGAAHLYGIVLPSSRENDELASLYAERGLSLALGDRDLDDAIQFAGVSAMIFNDLGQASDALERTQYVLEHRPTDLDARYEKAVALFELCRFDEAKPAFTALAEDPTRGAHAHHHLGLLLERDGKHEQAQKHFAIARKRAPEDFSPPVVLEAAEFEKEVKKVVAGLPDDMRKDVRDIPIGVEDVPRTDDLRSGEPPLSPTILGLFRGPPLSEPCEPSDTEGGRPCRSVAVYRLNLARAVRTKAELLEQIRVTLLHEIGHLRGEDDYELAARGLE